MWNGWKHADAWDDYTTPVGLTLGSAIYRSADLEHRLLCSHKITYKHILNIIYLLIFLSIYWILVSFTKIPKSTTNVFDIHLGAPVEQRLLKFKVEHIPLKFTSAKGLKCLKCCRWLSDLFPEACTCYQGNLWQMLLNVSPTCFFTCPRVCARVPRFVHVPPVCGLVLIYSQNIYM